MVKTTWKRRNYWLLASRDAIAIETRRVQKKPAVEGVLRVLAVVEGKRSTLTFARKDEVDVLGVKTLRWISDNSSTIENARGKETTRRLTLTSARMINVAVETMTRKLRSGVVLQGLEEESVRRKQNHRAELRVSGLTMMKSKLIYVVTDRVRETEKEKRLMSISDEARGRRVGRGSLHENGKSSSTNAENHHRLPSGRLRRLSSVDQEHHLLSRNLHHHHRHLLSVSHHRN